MTLPNERTRALLWAGGFLIELWEDLALAETIQYAQWTLALPSVIRSRVLVLAHAEIGDQTGLATGMSS